MKYEIRQRLFFLCLDLDKKLNRSKSFRKDIILLQDHFELDIDIIFAGPLEARKLIIETFKEPNGLKDSILLCLSNPKSKYYKNLLHLMLNKKF